MRKVSGILLLVSEGQALPLEVYLFPSSVLKVVQEAEGAEEEHEHQAS
jgi:hypothetical protein